VALRYARYGYLLALHILLLCAAGRRPMELAACLFCPRPSVYRTVRAYRVGTLGLAVDEDDQLLPLVRTTVLTPSLQRSLQAWLKAVPHAHGWCRTRWSGATLATALQAKLGITVSAEIMRRWLHQVGLVWKCVKLMAKDSDPLRVERLAPMRLVYEQLQMWESMGYADELAIHLLPKVWLCLDAQRHATGRHDPRD
jgi:hypothetical protein